MKFLLVQPLSYLFAAGGAHKANRLLLEGLVERGHECAVVSPIELERKFEDFNLSNEDIHAAMLEDLKAYDVELLPSADPNTIVYRLNGVTVHAVIHDLQMFSQALQRVLVAYAPDWTIITEDRSCLWLEMALEQRPGRVVYLAHSQATLPFGPESFEADPVKTEVLRRTTRILAVSTYLQTYIRQWGGMASDVLRFPSYGAGPYPFLANFDAGYVTMINPSVLKGAPIFIQLVKELPQVEFAVVPSWGTTFRERTILEHLPNVRFLKRSSDMNEVLRQVRVLLVPSLWGESFGQVCVDALLRGIPVLASDLGGLPEATLGAGVLVPVQPIAGYRRIHDAKQTPVPIVPPQNTTPWRAALERVLTDRDYYDQLATTGYGAAAQFVAGLSVDHFARYFEALEAEAQPVVVKDQARITQELIAQLSPEKRALLAHKLKQARETHV